MDINMLIDANKGMSAEIAALRARAEAAEAQPCRAAEALGKCISELSLHLETDDHEEPFLEKMREVMDASTPCSHAAEVGRLREAVEHACRIGYRGPVEVLLEECLRAALGGRKDEGRI